jgi:4-amino-4-deoxy-L-arabinose transferase-like glycosyltransferase
MGPVDITSEEPDPVDHVAGPRLSAFRSWPPGDDTLASIGVFIFAVVVRVIASFHFVPRNPLAGTSDGPGYQQLAVRFANGHLLSDPLYVLRPPGLPWLLGALYWMLGTHSPTVFVGLSVVCTSLTAVLALRIARLLDFSLRRAVVVGCLVALDPTFVLIGLKPLSDPLFALVCTGLVFLLLKARQANYRGVPLFGLALTLVLAVLVKPSAVLLWLFAFVALLGAKRRVMALAVTAVALVPIVAWTARNYVENGVPTYSSVTNYNLLVYRAGGVESRAEHKDYSTVVLPEIMREMSRRLPGTTVKHYYSYAAPTSKKVYDAELSLALHIISKHPLYYLSAIPVGLERLYLQSEEVPAGLAYLVATAWYVLVFALSVVKWPRIRRDSPYFAWLALGLVAYFSITTVIDITSGFGGTRIAMPFLPVLFITAAWPVRVAGVAPLRNHER